MPNSLDKHKVNVVDLVYKILEANGRPMNYRELIEEALKQVGIEADVRKIASVLTDINLDTRFSYAGQGEWALKSWLPTRGTRRLPTITLMNKSISYDDGDKRLDHLSDDGVELDYEEIDEEPNMDDDLGTNNDSW